MVEFHLTGKSDADIAAGGLLSEDEVILVVDDAPEIVLIISRRLAQLDLPTRGCHTAAEMFEHLAREKAALVLLDINLPDRNGAELLKSLVASDPDLGIVMITASADLKMALECLRQGADDYLLKPLSLELLTKVVTATLTKRKLVLENRRLQRALERLARRRQFLHRLGRTMNTAYLTFHELNSILRTILVGITAQEGLGFNRALLFLRDSAGFLRGRMAIGPDNPEEAGRVWSDIAAKGLSFDKILYDYHNDDGDIKINEIVRQMVVPPETPDHVAMVAVREKKSLMVTNGQTEAGVNVYDLPTMLGCGDFLVTPLISPRGGIGVIIVDNRITGAKIDEDDSRNLEMFASQASLAIERSRLHQEMVKKIVELEKVTRELVESREQVVAMERYSVIGQMTAQLTHDIRNPLTSIGGAAVWLKKKCDDDRYCQFLDIIIEESGRIESTLHILSSFTDNANLQPVRCALAPLVGGALLALHPELQAASIVSELTHPDEEIYVNVDVAKMREALLQLITIAISVMPDGGVLRVAISHGDGKATAAFNHSGLRLREQNRQSAASAPFHSGVVYKDALGLMLARRIIFQHGGSLQATFPEEGGVTDTVVLPEA
ncbi:MAG: response regulator [Desulfobulbaceae bacterium]|jgi:FixJ family two-component response regulator|nr:response regulator [Desulfobulbaceae bacterium]